MKIGRNQPWPCGGVALNIKCCLNKKDDSKITETLKNPFAYHDNYIHTKKVKATEINNKLLNIYDNNEILSTKQIIDDYLEIMNYILNYASKNRLHTIEEIDDANLVSDFMINVIYNMEDEVYNLNDNDYYLNAIIQSLDKLVSVLNLEDNLYENILRSKVYCLFKLGNYELGEQVILDLIKEKRNSIFAYVELVDEYYMIGDLKKYKYYYDLGMKRIDLSDLDALEERNDYFTTE